MKFIKLLLTMYLFECLVLVSAHSVYSQKQRDDNWIVRYNHTSVEQAVDVTLESDGFSIKSNEDIGGNSFIYCHWRLDKPTKAISFNYQSTVNTELAPIALLDAAANVLWCSNGQTDTPETVDLKNINAHGVGGYPTQ